MAKHCLQTLQFQYKMALHQFVHSCYVQQRGVSEESIFNPFIWGWDHKTLAKIVKNRCLEISSTSFDKKMGTNATPNTQNYLLPKLSSLFGQWGSIFLGIRWQHHNFFNNNGGSTVIRKSSNAQL
jgi:hypothetical protein